jgi:hypothetical protein
MMYGKRDRAAHGPGRQRRHPRRPRGPLRRRAQRGAVHAARRQFVTRGLTHFDDHVVDGRSDGTAAAFGGLSSRLRRWQTGFVRSYALSMLAGVVGGVLGPELLVMLMLTDFPWLTTAARAPGGGAGVVVLLPKPRGFARVRQAGRPRLLAGHARVLAAVIALQFDVGGPASFQ